MFCLSGSVSYWNGAWRRVKQAEQVCSGVCVVAACGCVGTGRPPCRTSVPLPGLEVSSAEEARERFAPSPWPELAAEHRLLPGWMGGKS